MGLFGGRPAEAEPKVKQLRRTLKGSGHKLTVQQVAYLTWGAQAADDPTQAAAYRGMQAELEMSAAEKSVADAILADLGVS